MGDLVTGKIWYARDLVCHGVNLTSCMQSRLCLLCSFHTTDRYRCTVKSSTPFEVTLCHLKYPVKRFQDGLLSLTWKKMAGKHNGKTFVKSR